MVMTLEELFQLARRDGLGQNPGKSEIEEFFAVFFTCMGGEGVGLWDRTARGLESLQGLNAVDFGHLDVHQDEVVGLAVTELQGLVTGRGDGQIQFPGLAHRAHHHLVGHHVLHVQHPQILQVDVGRSFDFRGICVIAEQGEVQGEAEGGAFTRGAVDVELGAHEFQDADDDAQSQAGPSEASGDAAVGLLEGVEDALLVFC